MHESEAGTELEIDHFRPKAAGGGDEFDNLVYCCATCNRLKGDFWPDSGPDDPPRRLLHPQRDDLTQHLRLDDDGHLQALTETGAFHRDRLRLNRPPLVALRRARQELASLREEVAAARAEQARLRARVVELGQEVEALVRQFSDFLEGQG